VNYWPERIFPQPISVYGIRKEMMNMKLDERTMRLIAVGSSITANCQPCLEANSTKALENGADKQEIAEAIEIGKMVRKGAASNMDMFALNLSNVEPSSAVGMDGGCECDSLARMIPGGKNG
jgi:AhpD family alkylhydroperoxidase